jgi:hypothetical protein
MGFKKILDLSFNDPAPDHFTFSRFRKRLSRNTLQDDPPFGLKDHAAVDVNNIFIPDIHTDIFTYDCHMWVPVGRDFE